MTASVVGLSIAYAVLGVVLLLMSLRSPYRWWIKATAIVVTSAFFIVAYFQTHALLGWPIVEKMPARFQLLWVRVLEPSRAYGEPGAIFMWVEALDENNVPSGTPRAFRLRYTSPLADKAEKAREQLMQGAALEGTAQDMSMDEEGHDMADAKGNLAEAPAGAERADQGAANLDLEFLAQQPQRLEFAPLQGPLLPVKGAQ